MRNFLIIASMITVCTLGIASGGESPKELTLEELHEAVRNDKLVKNGVKYTLTHSPSFGNLLTGGGVSVGTVLSDGTIVDSYNQQKIVGHLREYVPDAGAESNPKEAVENTWFTTGDKTGDGKYHIETTNTGEKRLFRNNVMGMKTQIGIVQDDGTVLDIWTVGAFTRRVMGHVTDYIPDWKP